MSKVSKLRTSRDNWKQKSTQRGDSERYLKKGITRIKNERDALKTQLQETQALLEAERKKKAPLAPKLEVVHMSLRLFLEARVSFRAVSRVLTMLSKPLGIEKAPSHQTVINWLLRYSLAKMQPVNPPVATHTPSGDFSNGFIWMIDTSIGIGDGKILAVIAVDVNHHEHHKKAPTLKDVHCVGVSVSPSWNGNNIAEFLKKVIANIGRPAAYLKDGGSDLNKAVNLLGEAKLGSPKIDDVSHKIANLVKREYGEHPLFATFVSACGKVSKNLKQTILACLAPPKVNVKARFMNLHRVVTWADRILNHSPAGRAAEGSLLAKLRDSLDVLPECKPFIDRFIRDAKPLLECQKVIKHKGLSDATKKECLALLTSIPASSSIRKGFVEWMDNQIDIAEKLGVNTKGLVISTDQLESLFGVGKRHGTGDVKDANRIAMRLPALCGEVTKDDARQVLDISVAQQQEMFGEVTSTIGQRRQVLTHPGELETLKNEQGVRCFELIASPKKWLKIPGSPLDIRDLKDLNGPPIDATADVVSPSDAYKNELIAVA